MPRNAPNPICVGAAQKLLRAGQLINRVYAALRRRLAEDPQDAGALLRLGDLFTAARLSVSAAFWPEVA